jgi:hypothetical protein
MTTIEIRHEIIQKLFQVESEPILVQILSLLNVSDPEQGDWWSDLTPSQQNMIEKGSQEVSNGGGTPHSEFRQEIKEWFASKSNK